MGSGLSTELGTGLARIGPVARVVHEYIGGATIIMAYSGNRFDATEVCGIEGDTYAMNALRLYQYDALLSAVKHHQNKFAEGIVVSRFVPSLSIPYLERIAGVIVRYKNIEFLKGVICRHDISSDNIRCLCHALVYGITTHKWRGNRVFIAQCITMPLPKGRNITNHFITAPFAYRAIPFVREALPDSENAARFEREVRAA